MYLEQKNQTESKGLARNQTIKIPQVPLSHPTGFQNQNNRKNPGETREMGNTVRAPPKPKSGIYGAAKNIKIYNGEHAGLSKATHVMLPETRVR